MEKTVTCNMKWSFKQSKVFTSYIKKQNKNSKKADFFQKPVKLGTMFADKNKVMWVVFF